MPWLAPARNGSAWECSWTRTTAATGCWWWVLGTVALCKDGYVMICLREWGFRLVQSENLSFNISINKDLTLNIGLSSNKRWDFHLQNQQIFFPQRHWAPPVTSPASQVRRRTTLRLSLGWWFWKGWACCQILRMVIRGLSNAEDDDDWWFGTWILWLPIQLGMESSSQLTNSMIFQRGRSTQPPTRLWLTIINHTITIY